MLSFCFVFRRKRKGKGAKGKGKSGGRGNQKGAKLQSKTPQPSPTTNSTPAKLPHTKENQFKPTENTDKPDGVPTTSKRKEDARKSSAGRRKIMDLL